MFARGTSEAAGLGSVGSPFVSALTSDLSGQSVSSYAVNYSADIAQTSAGAGATDMSNHISSVAASCPNTKFVIGGYSQGATVTDIALGIRTSTGGTGTAIPANLQGRVVAAVVFGNPLGLQRQTIAQADTAFASKSIDYCGDSDPVCGEYQSNVSGSHLSYATNGATTQGATFAAKLAGTAATTPAPTPTPTPTPTLTPTPTTTPAGACYTASTFAQVSAARAVTVFGSAYARGTNTYLGFTNTTTIVSLRQTGTNTWSKVTSC